MKCQGCKQEREDVTDMKDPVDGEEIYLCTDCVDYYNKNGW